MVRDAGGGAPVARSDLEIVEATIYERMEYRTIAEFTVWDLER